MSIYIVGGLGHIAECGDGHDGWRIGDWREELQMAEQETGSGGRKGEELLLRVLMQQKHVETKPTTQTQETRGKLTGRHGPTHTALIGVTCARRPNERKYSHE